MDGESQAGIPVTCADSGFLCPGDRRREREWGLRTGWGGVLVGRHVERKDSIC